MTHGGAAPETTDDSRSLDAATEAEEEAPTVGEAIAEAGNTTLTTSDT